MREIVRTRFIARTLLCVLSAAPAFGFATSAAAQAKLEIKAKGQIQPSCSLSATQNFPSSNLNQPGSASAKANVNCNQLFKVRATSTYGAIKSNTAASGMLTNALPYSLKVDVGLDDGSTQSQTCASASLVAGNASCLLSPAGAGLASNGQIATNKITTLTATWTPPSAPTLLVPGSYSDTITLTIATVP